MEVKYLVMVTIDDTNHNKYYKMIPNEDGKTFRVEYGRVGANPQVRTYPMSVWHQKYDEKIYKGYTDQSYLHQSVVKQVTHDGYADISDESVQKLVDVLLNYANIFIKKTYKVSHKEVTEEMLDEAQELINRMGKVCDVCYFNDYLRQLFAIIPRRMANVTDYIASSHRDFAEIITREQDTLDVMSSMVDKKRNVEHISDAEQDGKGTILDAMGIKIRPCTEEEIGNVKRKLTDESVSKMKCAYRIENTKLEKRFNDYCKSHRIRNRDIHFYYHGTKNQNVWNIMKTGLLLNPNAPITGKMFGHGIYFAPRAKKSINYTSISLLWDRGNMKKEHTGFLLVFKVAYKNPLHVYSYGEYFKKYTAVDVEKTGNDALFAHKDTGMLINDELIVYREEQCIPRYLIELAA